MGDPSPEVPSQAAVLTLLAESTPRVRLYGTTTSRLLPVVATARRRLSRVITQLRESLGWTKAVTARNLALADDILWRGESFDNWPGDKPMTTLVHGLLAAMDAANANGKIKEATHADASNHPPG